MAIAGVLSPSRTLETYQQLLAYMGDELNRETILLQKPTYAEINDLVRGQHVELAIVCSGAYVPGNQEFGMELLVAPRFRENRYITPTWSCLVGALPLAWRT